MKTETKRENVFYQELIKGESKKFAPKKTKTMMVELVTIGPMEAKHILKHYNTKNRRPSKVVVTKYSTDMRNGAWKAAGQTISFDCNGTLLDGQQRLLAVVTTGLPQMFVVVYGLEPSAFDVIDNGKTRSNGDVLEMHGYDEPTILSALIRSVIAYQTAGNLDAHNGFKGSHQITKSQIVEYIEKDPKVVNFMDRYKKCQLVSPSIAAFCYWLLSTVDKKYAEAYLDEVFMGYGLEPDTIQAYLFNKLQRNRNALQNKMNKTAIISNVVLGWRRYMGYSNSQAMQLSWDTRKGIPQPC